MCVGLVRLDRLRRRDREAAHVAAANTMEKFLLLKITQVDLLLDQWIMDPRVNRASAELNA